MQDDPTALPADETEFDLPPMSFRVEAVREMDIVEEHVGPKWRKIHVKMSRDMARQLLSLLGRNLVTEDFGELITCTFEGVVE